MRIALVGGAGFIGHHLALRLRQDGHDILILDHLAINSHVNQLERRGGWTEHYIQFLGQRSDLWRSAGCDFAVADATDYHGLSRKLSDWRPDAIIHLAAIAHITHTRSDKHKAWKQNIDTLRNSLDAAVAVQAKRFVFFSSSTVYGNFAKPVLTELDAPKPDNRYGRHKLMGEIMVHDAAEEGLSYTIVRPQALYGPRCVSRRVTQLFLENALDQKPLRIDGDGSACHDFTHIDDLTSGVANIFGHFEESHNQTFCLTAGKARSLLDLANIVNANIPAEIIHGPPDPEKPSRGTMSPDKAHKLLGWEPRIGLDAGMASYANWYKEWFYAPEERKVPRYDQLQHSGVEINGPSNETGSGNRAA